MIDELSEAMKANDKAADELISSLSSLVHAIQNLRRRNMELEKENAILRKLLGMKAERS